MLVHEAYRGQKLAQQMMTEALRFIELEIKEATVKIQAQDYLRNFYSSFGFKPITETYLEDGIPHVDMILKK